MLETGGIYILGVTGIIGVILYAKRYEWILDLLVRGCTGIVLLYGINVLLNYLGYEKMVGLNLVTILCVTILGMPGVILLYASAFFLQL